MSSDVERYAKAAFDAGVPADQFRRLLQAGVVLHPQQLRACAAARRCDKPGGPTQIGFGGARGGGKSFWSMTQAAVDDLQRAPGANCLFLRKVAKAGQESAEALSRAVLKETPHKWNRARGRIHFPNGSQIMLGNYRHPNDVDKYLGLEYEVIIVEEATTLPRATVTNIRTCNRTALPGFRPRMYLTTNPGGVGHNWFRDEFVRSPDRDGLGEGPAFIPSRADQNPYLNEDYIRTALDPLRGWLRSAWRDGNWDISAGTFFDNWDPDVHVVDPFEIPSNWPMWLSLDYGFQHPTVAYALARSPEDGATYVCGEHWGKKMLPSQHASAIKGMLGRLGRRVESMEKRVAGADLFASRPTSERSTVTIADAYSQHGIRFSKAIDDRIAGWAELQRLIGQPNLAGGDPARIFVFRTCALIQSQIPSLQHHELRPEDVLKIDADPEGDGSDGDDAADALRYGLMAMKGKRVVNAY